jgi:hypothetical protein
VAAPSRPAFDVGLDPQDVRIEGVENRGELASLEDVVDLLEDLHALRHVNARSGC